MDFTTSAGCGKLSRFMSVGVLYVHMVTTMEFVMGYDLGIDWKDSSARLNWI
jgi:hypothetical protein